MKLFAKAILISIVMLTAACKKKQPGTRVAEEAKGEQPIANAFAVKSAIAIYDAPEVRAKAIGTLPIGTRVDIFSSHVPDKKEPDKSFWYKVKYSPASASADKPVMPVEGFVSEREEVLRQNFLVFKPRGEESEYRDDGTGKQAEVKGPAGAMAMTALKLRKSPALNGQVIRTLKNGEVLKVLEVSSATVEIDGKNANWYQVADDAGATGYVFGGYLVTGLYEGLGKLRDAGFQFMRGWIVLNEDVKPYRHADGMEPDKLETPGFREKKYATGILPKNTLLRVDAEVTQTAEKRYRAIIRNEVEPGYFEEYKIFVPKARAKFTKDYFTISKSNPHTVDVKLAEALNAFIGGDLNLQCTKATRFDVGTGGDVRHMLSIATATGPESSTDEYHGKNTCYETLTSSAIMAEEKDGSFVVLGKAEVSDINFTDLDGDGIPELISEYSHPRGGYGLSIFGLKNNRLAPIFVWSGDRASGCMRMEFKGKYILLDYEDYYKEQLKAGEKSDYCKSDAEELRERYKGLPFAGSGEIFPYYAKLENGKFVQIEKPADLPAENPPAN